MSAHINPYLDRERPSFISGAVFLISFHWSLDALLLHWFTASLTGFVPRKPESNWRALANAHKTIRLLSLERLLGQGFFGSSKPVFAIWMILRFGLRAVCSTCLNWAETSWFLYRRECTYGSLLNQDLAHDRMGKKKPEENLGLFFVTSSNIDHAQPVQSPVSTETVPSSSQVYALPRHSKYSVQSASRSAYESQKLSSMVLSTSHSS